MRRCSLLFLKFAKGLAVPLVVVGACYSGRESGYPYYHELKKYAGLYHHFDLSSFTGYLLIIPTGGCSCVREAMELAARVSHRPDVAILVLTDSPKKLLPYRELIQKIQRKNLYIEKSGNNLYFQLGISGPVIIQLQSDQVIYFQKLTTQNIYEVASDIFYK